MLEVQNCYKAFDGVDVLNGVSLRVDKGDVITVIGPSGSGKTTLLRCINSGACRQGHHALWQSDH